MGTLLTSITKMKPRYIGVWLKDQLSRPDWFRNMFVNRFAWGAFSIYAHAKRSDGKSKISYKNKTKAEKAAFDMAKRYGYPFITYKCLFCDGWHVSKAVKRNTEGKTTEEVAKMIQSQIQKELSFTAKPLDHKRMLELNDKYYRFNNIK